MQEGIGAVGRDRIRVEDRRLTDVLVQRAALATIAERFTGRRGPVARSIYVALAELALAAVADATRATIAEYAMVTRKTLDDYVPELEEAGLIAREQQLGDDGRNLPNLWVLLDPLVEGGTRTTLPHADDPPRSSSTTSRSRRGRRTGGVGSVSLPLEGAPLLLPAVRADAEELLRQRRRVDGRQVTPEEMLKAAVAVSAFNQQQRAEHGLGAYLTAIVGRVRERPSYDAAALERLVASAWRIRWWERTGRRGRRPTPQVIFGNSRVFEAVVQDAIAEKAGERVEPAATSRRYMRED